MRPYRDDRFDGITLRPEHDSVLNRQLASHSHYELGGGPFQLSVGSTDGELSHGFERIIVSLPIALVAHQLLQERPSRMAAVSLGRSHHDVSTSAAFDSCRPHNRIRQQREILRL